MNDARDDAPRPRLDRAHLRRHLDALGNMLHFLRTLPPDGPRYKVWLGDVVEFVHDAFGEGSPQMQQVRDALIGEGRLPREADATERTRAYLDRLDRFGRVLAGFLRSFADPLPMLDAGLNGRAPGQEER